MKIANAIDRINTQIMRTGTGRSQARPIFDKCDNQWLRCHGVARLT
jgi:hypothetical protein